MLHSLERVVLVSYRYISCRATGTEVVGSVGEFWSRCLEPPVKTSSRRTSRAGLVRPPTLPYLCSSTECDTRLVLGVLESIGSLKTLPNHLQSEHNSINLSIFPSLNKKAHLGIHILSRIWMQSVNRMH